MMPVSIAFRIVEALTRQIRIVSMKQAKDCWWPDFPNTKRARRKLMQMVERGWIERHLINAHPLC